MNDSVIEQKNPQYWLNAFEARRGELENTPDKKDRVKLDDLEASRAERKRESRKRQTTIEF